MSGLGFTVSGFDFTAQGSKLKNLWPRLLDLGSRI